MDAKWRAGIDEHVDSVLSKLCDVREHLHAHPEPSGEEFETTAYLSEQLDKTRLNLRTVLDARGLIVEPKNGGDAARIALRADVDALRIQDAKNTPYRSQREGVMHACGHDAHAAVVLGALLALDALEAAGGLPWPVPWRVIFQPAEETNRGALDMVQDGALEDVGAIISVHMDPSRECGKVGFRKGLFTADCVEMSVRIIGKGGHAARPHESQDPIATAAQLISSIYHFVPRSTEPHDPVVVSFGQVHGGSTPNSIPEEVLMHGTLRTFSETTRHRTMDHIRKLSRGLAVASDTDIVTDFLEGPPAIHNDPDLTSVMRSEALDLLGEVCVDEIALPSMGGEDFANYLTHVPGSMFRLGCAPSEGAGPSLHSPHFDIEPASLGVGAKVLARAAVAWARPED